MEIKPCGGAVFYRGACRDRYLGRRDCAGCEPLAITPTDDPAPPDPVDAADGADPASVDEPSSDADAEPAKPRAPRGAKRRP